MDYVQKLMDYLMVRNIYETGSRSMMSLLVHAKNAVIENTFELIPGKLNTVEN